MTVLGFILPSLDEFVMYYLMLTAGIVLYATSSTIATVGKELMSNEIDMANPRMAQRYGLVSFSLTIFVQLIMSFVLYNGVIMRIDNMTADNADQVREQYGSLILIFLFMMFVETCNAHCAGMLQALGHFRRELITRAIVLTVI
jgi:Na+-driven multidrug efflux pump